MSEREYEPGQDPETLLPIQRKFTDREKLDWVRKQYKEFELKYSQLLSENQSLTDRNRNLQKKLDEWTEEIPGSFKHDATISVKAYTKLRKRCDMYEARVWELVEEVKQLKSKLIV